MGNFIDLTNQKFGRLTVIKREENDIRNCAQWLCKCDCGNTIIVSGNHLRTSHTRSCGCLQKEVCSNIKHSQKHGMSHTRIYKIWSGIKRRTNPNSIYKTTTYRNYIGRNIKMYDEWKNDFKKFYDWAMANGYQDNLTIDRIDVNGNYEPSNCRWTTMKIQQNNRRNNVVIEYNNEKHTVSEWNEIMKFPPKLLYNRIRRGWNLKKALTTKKGGNNGK